MIRAAVLSLALVMAAAPVAGRAAEAPLPGRLDSRIRTVFYDPDQVVQLKGFLGYQMMIEFAPGERIENVAIGDALAWQVTPNKNADLLFIKPIADMATNMTVVTDTRRYAFELAVEDAPGASAREMAYIIRFTYPPPPAPPPAQVAAAPVRNLAYSYKGSRKSLPSAVFDDGRFTYFAWPKNTPIPAIFVVDRRGAESLVNFGVRDGYVVVDQVARRFSLRNGKDVTTVINDAWREPSAGPLAPQPYGSKAARQAARAQPMQPMQP